MPKLNENYQNVKDSYLFAEIARRVKVYEETHPEKAADIIRLGIGDVTLPLTKSVIEALHEAVDSQAVSETFKGYGPEQGYAFAQEAIADYYARNGVEVKVSDIFISDGAKSDTGNITELFAKDNVVLVPDPVYPVYVDTNTMDGKNIIYMNGTKENDFLPMPDENVKADIINYLMNQELPVEMTDDDYVDFMIWHRGLAVPAARNLDDPDVQKGRSLFREIGCASCHRPSWKTGKDNFTDPSGFFSDGDARLPRYPDQTIWPYSDFVQHRLYMENDIRTGWCRTTPLWGRGLSAICTGASDRLHDCRARNVIEAIMWHGNAQSDARWTIEKFRTLSKEDREAVVKFIEAI